MQSRTVDPFWTTNYVANVEQLPNATACHAIQLSVKPTLTQEQRFTALMSTFQPVARLASNSIPDTKNLMATLNFLFTNLSTKEGQSKKTESSQSQQVERELIANPRLFINQSQRRKQPIATGAPTTTASKAAARASQRERKEMKKVRDARAHGQL